MLSISPPMSSGQGLTSYFTGCEDYYLSSPGLWQGKGAAMLGLTEKVSREQFRLVSNGFHPGTSELLVPGKEVDGKNKKQAGNDLTFSAGKSISIAAAVNPQIKVLHERSVAKVIDFVEQNNMQTRQQVAGKREVVDTGNLTVAKFTHMTSRALDPQLHTHSFLFNLTKRADGEWRALHNRSIFQDKMALGRLYRSELFRELSQAGYGLEITDQREGFYRIKGVPEQLVDHFSKRRAEIEAKIKDPKFQEKYPNADKATLYQLAALGTRSRKKQISGQEIKNHWRKEVEGQGYTLDQIKIGIEKSKNFQNIEAEKEPEAIIDQAIEAATVTDSVFRKTQILEIAATLDFGRHTIAELDQAFRSSSNIIYLGRERQNGRAFFTSREMLKIEKSVIDTAKAGCGKRQPIATRQEVADTISGAEQKNGWQYTAGQRAAITALATAKDRVMVIQGDAGTGKTAAMSVFHNIAKSKGYKIRGLGFTGKSADELEKGAGIQSQTIDSFLQNPNDRKKNEIWLVDESSMAGSRHYAEILNRAKKQNSTVVFLGDTKQFQSIAAGRMFQDLQSAIGVHARLEEVMRQKTPETRAVVASLNQDRYDEAFGKLKKQGNLKEYKSKNDLQRAAVQHYCNAARETKSAVVITASNADRRQLNQKIKAELVRSGQIEQGTEHTVLTTHNVSAAQAGFASSYTKDQVAQIHKPIPGLKAGQAGRVIGIDHDRNSITIELSQKQHTLDIGKHHSRLSIYDQQTINLSPNDKIIFLKNDRKLKVKNGQIGTIRNIDDRGNVTARVIKRTVKFSLAEHSKKQLGDAKYVYRHIDHAYAITTHKSQGATFDNVIYHALARAGQDRQIDRRSAYVAATRARDKFTILTDSKKRLGEAVSKDRSKASIADFEQQFKSQFRLKKIQNKIKAVEKEARSHRPKVDMGDMGMGR